MISPQHRSRGRHIQPGEWLPPDEEAPQFQDRTRRFAAETAQKRNPLDASVGGEKAGTTDGPRREPIVREKLQTVPSQPTRPTQFTQPTQSSTATPSASSTPLDAIYSARIDKARQRRDVREQKEKAASVEEGRGATPQRPYPSLKGAGPGQLQSAETVTTTGTEGREQKGNGRADGEAWRIGKRKRDGEKHSGRQDSVRKRYTAKRRKIPTNGTWVERVLTMNC